MESIQVLAALAMVLLADRIPRMDSPLECMDMTEFLALRAYWATDTLAFMEWRSSVASPVSMVLPRIIRPTVDISRDTATPRLEFMFGAHKSSPVRSPRSSRLATNG